MALQLFIEFWPSQPTLSIFFYLEQVSSTMVLLSSVYHYPDYKYQGVNKNLLSLLHDFMSLGHKCDYLFPRHRFKPNFSALYCTLIL